MPTRTRKVRGSSSQALVAEWYQRLWPAATSAGAGARGRDVLNVPVDIEVKARARFDPLAWAKQQRDRGGHPDDVLPPHTVLRMNGLGEANVGWWMVLRPLAEDTVLLQELLELRAEVTRLRNEADQVAFEQEGS